MAETVDVIIVGAGLAGLCCARRLAAGGKRAVVLEAADRVGGRIATDTVRGFRIDRGFQVLLTSYPEVRDVLRLDELRLGAFAAGALVRTGDHVHRVADAWRQPLRGVLSLLTPIVSATDALRLAQLRAAAVRGKLPGEQAVMTTRDLLAARGFSQPLRELFLEPFFRGVTLDPELAVPGWYFAFLFAMFARGKATLPAAGMQAIGEQIAAGLPPGTVRLSSPVQSVRAEAATLASGEELAARRVVVAADAHGAAELFDAPQSPAWNGTSALSFAAERSPIGEPILMLAGDRDGPVNHVCCPSDAQPSYAPAGAALVSASVVHAADDPPGDDLEAAVRRQLRGWFGAQVDGWEHLRTDHVPRALPRLRGAEASGWSRRDDGVVVCGDYLATPSIQGAMAAGRRAAEAVLADLAAPAAAR